MRNLSCDGSRGATEAKRRICGLAGSPIGQLYFAVCPLPWVLNRRDVVQV
jgi:hypothetical protein